MFMSQYKFRKNINNRRWQNNNQEAACFTVGWVFSAQAAGPVNTVSTVYSVPPCSSLTQGVYAGHGHKPQFLAMTFINSYKYNSCCFFLKVRKMKSSNFLHITLCFCEVSQAELRERFQCIKSFIYTVKRLLFHHWPAQQWCLHTL